MAVSRLAVAPGAPREGYFEGLRGFAVNGRPSDEEMAEFYRLQDNVWLSSPAVR